MTSRSSRPDAAGASSSVGTPEDPLELAAALAVEGRCSDAVDVLMDANRSQRSPALERELVRLRHAAFAELDRSQTAETSPPVSRTRAAIATVPPVVSAGDLTPELLRSGILRHGSLHVRGVVPEPRVRELVDGIDRAIAAAEKFSSGPDRELTPWFEPFRVDSSYPDAKAVNRRLWNRRAWVREAGGVWGADSPRMLFELFDTLEAVGMLPLLSEYLGERPALTVDKCTLRRVAVDTNADWHQDGAFLGPGIRTVNMWLSLSECGRDAPGLDFVPARLDRIVDTGTEGAVFPWSVGPGVVDRVSASTPVVRPVFGAGDVLVLRRPLLAPDRDRSGDDPRALCDRDLVLRSFGVSGEVRPTRGLSMNNYWAFLPMRDSTDLLGDPDALEAAARRRLVPLLQEDPRLRPAPDASQAHPHRTRRPRVGPEKAVPDARGGDLPTGSRGRRGLPARVRRGATTRGVPRARRTTTRSWTSCVRCSVRAPSRIRSRSRDSASRPTTRSRHRPTRTTPTTRGRRT